MPGMQAAGRLDADSTGLLWTDDAALVQHIIGPNTVIERSILCVSLAMQSGAHARLRTLSS